ncbi:DDE-type integrase/transposase/recombinase [Bradyrhizobium cajani]|uniref:DDE-type integrase/transposase/recombinase n=1 Tax=Bradyrhizobium cajani TaxID=1928661 RepID=UPI001FE68879|nr:DDE-type integrase/transposase/recombinase [Bradyrhizobium cajani]MCP3367928.1 DDE-type integrase/transposase/recombinase [Bradyrhizobium cajani]
MGQLTVPQHANHVWALDHKGWIRLGDGCRVEPFTVTDGFSRYLISLAATGSTQYAECRPPLERAFREYGLPQIIRSDNGSPFASTGTTGLTALSVWWIKLGIRHERIDPGHPQQNGRHERFHATLLEAMRPPPLTRAVQARRFAAFARDYNEERPHEDLPAPISLRLARCQGGFQRRNIRPKLPCARFVPTARSNGVATSSTFAALLSMKLLPSRKPRTDTGKCASSTCRSASSTRKPPSCGVTLALRRSGPNHERLLPIHPVCFVTHPSAGHSRSEAG